MDLIEYPDNENKRLEELIEKSLGIKTSALELSSGPRIDLENINVESLSPGMSKEEICQVAEDFQPNFKIEELDEKVQEEYGIKLDSSLLKSAHQLISGRRNRVSENIRVASPDDSLPLIISVFKIGEYSVDLKNATNRAFGSNEEFLIFEIIGLDNITEKEFGIADSSTSRDIVISRSVAPGDLVRVVGTCDRNSFVSAELIASLIDEWNDSYGVRVECIAKDGIDLFFCERPKSPLEFLLEVSKRNPEIFRASEITEDLISKLKSIASSFEETSVLSLYWL